MKSKAIARAWSFLVILGAAWFMFLAGCANDNIDNPKVISGGPDKVVFRTNQPATFYVRPNSASLGDEEGWKMVAEGTKEGTITGIKGMRWDVKISAAGWKDQIWHVSADSQPEYKVTFYDSERIGPTTMAVVPVIPTALPTEPPLGPVRKKFAVVIGLSKYQHAGERGLESLRYAADDARRFADFLQRPEGGSFDKDKVILKVDEQATTQGVSSALREALRGTQRDDLVVIYWAGHGMPDPTDKSNKLYLITHDTDPAHMASTGYSMSDFSRDLGEIPARRLMIMIDVCHSGSIVDPTSAVRGPVPNKIAEATTRLANEIPNLQAHPPENAPATQPSAAPPGRTPMFMVFSACDKDELSRESDDLKGGYFTHYLIEGLAGDADFSSTTERRVTLGKLVYYTKDRVARGTDNRQHPAAMGIYDPEFSLGTGN